MPDHKNNRMSSATLKQMCKAMMKTAAKAIISILIQWIDRYKYYREALYLNTLNVSQCIATKCKGTSNGPDNVCYEMLLNLSIASQLDLLIIFNRIWDDGSFPDDLALVILILIPASNPNNKNNYRPISLTSCVCKLFERMAFDLVVGK